MLVLHGGVSEYTTFGLLNNILGSSPTGDWSQLLFSGENKKNISKCCLLNFLLSMLSV